MFHRNSLLSPFTSIVPPILHYTSIAQPWILREGARTPPWEGLIKLSTNQPWKIKWTIPAEYPHLVKHKQTASSTASIKLPPQQNSIAVNCAHLTNSIEKKSYCYYGQFLFTSFHINVFPLHFKRVQTIAPWLVGFSVYLSFLLSCLYNFSLPLFSPYCLLSNLFALLGFENVSCYLSDFFLLPDYN